MLVGQAVVSSSWQARRIAGGGGCDRQRHHRELRIDQATGAGECAPAVRDRGEQGGSEQAALTVFENMSKVARRNLSARLEYLGYIPSDDRLKCATQLGKSVVEAFPAAVSARSYLELSQKLLRLPVQQDESAVGISGMVQSLIKHITRQHSGEVTHVVN